MPGPLGSGSIRPMPGRISKRRPPSAESHCCAPSTIRDTSKPEVEPRKPGWHRATKPTAGMVLIPGGPFRMGSEDWDVFPDDGEGPVRRVEVAAFHIAPKAVTNSQFAAFVQATGYVSDAEQFGWSFVFHSFVESHQTVDGRVQEAPWWLAVRGATWREPEGPGSHVRHRQNHPVVHISWNDAMAYCIWTGTRLPTETEWEKAARGGLDRARFPWGDELTTAGEHRCNIWQGTFPTDNTGVDGYIGTAPVDAYRPNGFGLHNMSGNVWEWCNDWWSTDWHTRNADETRINPTGPRQGVAKVIRGGSYLCHDSYCNRYRVSSRTGSTPDSTTGHAGFRCAADATGTEVM